MSKVRATALGLSLAAIMTIAGVPAGAGPLPASLATVKTAAPTDVAQARWGGWHGGWRGGGWGWRGGGWGWRRGWGWGFPGAFVGSLAIGAAVGGPYSGYNSYSYYNPPYPYCDPYTYCGGYASYGGPYYGGYRAAYWGGGPWWGVRRWGWGGW